VAGFWARTRRFLIPDGFLSGLVFILAAAPIMAFGLFLIMRTTWGVGPWDVLHLGLAQRTGLTVGRAHQLTGLSLVILTLLLGGRTVTLITLINTTLVGLWLDWYNARNVLPVIPGLTGLPVLAAGLLLMGFGIALYLHPGLGAGPRDGLMLTLSQRTGQPIARVKVAMDVTAMLAGLVLGGPAGLGTVAVALGLGPSIQFFRQMLGAVDARVRARRPKAARASHAPLHGPAVNQQAAPPAAQQGRTIR